MKKLFLILGLIWIFSFTVQIVQAARGDIFDPYGGAVKNPEYIKEKVGVYIYSNDDTELPTGSLQKEIFPQVIKIILGLASLLTFIAFIYSGIQFLTAQGNEEELTKAKNILSYTFLGLIFVLLSYAIVYGILNIQWS